MPSGAETTSEDDHANRLGGGRDALRLLLLAAPLLLEAALALPLLGLELGDLILDRRVQRLPLDELALDPLALLGALRDDLLLLGPRLRELALAHAASRPGPRGSAPRSGRPPRRCARPSRAGRRARRGSPIRGSPRASTARPRCRAPRAARRGDAGRAGGTCGRWLGAARSARCRPGSRRAAASRSCRPRPRARGSGRSRRSRASTRSASACAALISAGVATDEEVAASAATAATVTIASNLLVWLPMIVPSQPRKSLCECPQIQVGESTRADGQGQMTTAISTRNRHTVVATQPAARAGSRRS